MSQVFTYDVVTLTELIESKPYVWDKTRGYVFKERVKDSFQISYSQHWMYPVLSFAFFVFSPKIQEHKQVALPISISTHKHLSCPAFNIRLATGSGNAGTCEKLNDQSRIRFRQKVGVCASGLTSLTRHSYSNKVGRDPFYSNDTYKAYMYKNLIVCIEN
jgi:hypothetical protein